VSINFVDQANTLTTTLRRHPLEKFARIDRFSCLFSCYSGKIVAS